MILRVFSCWLWVSVSHFYTRQTFYQANGLRWAPDAPPQSRYVAASLGWEPRLITCSFCVSVLLFPCEMIRRTFFVCWETILHFFNQSPPLSFFFSFRCELDSSLPLLLESYEDRKWRTELQKEFFFQLTDIVFFFLFFFCFTDFYDCRIRGHAGRPPPPCWRWSHLCSWPAVTPNIHVTLN